MDNLLVVGLLLVLVGIILKLTYYNNKNYFFGYRSTLSMKNLSNWNLANKVSSTYLIITGVFVILAGNLANYILPINYQYYFVYTIMALGIFITIFITEKKLRENDKKNNT